MSPVRVVVTSEWRFVDDPEAARGALDHQPFQRWVYTIYSTGQIYVHVETTATTETWVPPNLGLAVTLASAVEDDTQVRIGAVSERSEPERSPVYATVRSEASDAFLLYAVDDTDRSLRMIQSAIPVSTAAGTANHTSLTAVTDQLEQDVKTWACQILLAGADKVSDEEANLRAADYADPAALRIEVGSLVPVSGGPGARNGFDPASGCHTIAPDRDLVRFVIDGQRQPRHAPVFRIVDPDDREAWIYVDHLVFDRVARDAQGNLIFQLPGTIRKPTMVEVHFGTRRPGA